MSTTTVTVRTGGTGIDTRDFQVLTKALRQSAPRVAKDLREGLRKAGELVAVEAKAIASKHSTTIPATIKVRVSSATIAVVAGGANAPTAGLFELGNTGGHKSAAASRRGTFRHPVFGNRQVWVDQAMHPFLAPAAMSQAPRVERLVVNALNRATDTLVFGH